MIREKSGVLTLWMAVSGLMFAVAMFIFLVSIGQVHGKSSDKLTAEKLADDIADKIDWVMRAAYDSSARVDLPKAAEISISGSTVSVGLDNAVGTATFSSPSAMSSGTLEGSWSFQKYITISKTGSVMTLGGE